MTVELEELEEFSLDPTSIVLVDDTYTITFPINFINGTD
jgi:hypothetical protein